MANPLTMNDFFVLEYVRQVAPGRSSRTQDQLRSLAQLSSLMGSLAATLSEPPFSEPDTQIEETVQLAAACQTVSLLSQHQIARLLRP